MPEDLPTPEKSVKKIKQEEKKRKKKEPPEFIKLLEQLIVGVLTGLIILIVDRLWK